MNEFREFNVVQDKCCQLALRQPLLGKQLILMTDTKFQAAEYAVWTEDGPNGRHTSTRKTYAPVAYGSKTFTHSHTKMSFFNEEIFATYLTLKDF